MKRLWHQVSFDNWVKNWQLKYKVLPQYYCKLFQTELGFHMYGQGKVGFLSNSPFIECPRKHPEG